MKKRKLKQPMARRPKDRVGIDAIVNDVHKETGFSKKDIKEVYRAIMKAWIKRMFNGQSIIVPSLGTIMPWLKPRSRKLALYGGRKDPKMISTPPKWSLKLVPMRGVKKYFGTKEVTEEQEDFLYED